MSYATAGTVSWWQRASRDEEDLLVAYFSMEFGIHERLPIYSGGLGVLAGDHLKAAAELGVAIVGVGLLYTGGYFRQGVDKSGRQTEDYQPVDPEAVGLVREDVSVTVDLAGESIEAAVWRKDVTSAVGVVPPVHPDLACRAPTRRREPNPPRATASPRTGPRTVSSRCPRMTRRHPSGPTS